MCLGVPLPQYCEIVSKSVWDGISTQNAAGVWSLDLLAFPCHHPMGKEWGGRRAVPQLRAWVEGLRLRQHRWQLLSAPGALGARSPRRGHCPPGRGALQCARAREEPAVNPRWFSDSASLWREGRERSGPVYMRKPQAQPLTEEPWVSKQQHDCSGGAESQNPEGRASRSPGCRCLSHLLGLPIF